MVSSSTLTCRHRARRYKKISAASPQAAEPSPTLEKPVGSKPAAKGHFQQLDLVGSVWEWALDGWQENYPTSAQANHAKLDAEKFRTMRGGCWDSTAKLAHGASRTGLTPTTNYDQVGIRCARNL